MGNPIANASDTSTEESKEAVSENAVTVSGNEKTADAAEDDLKTEKGKASTLTGKTDDGKYVVTVSYDENAKIPSDSTLSAKELSADSNEYKTAKDLVINEDESSKEVSATSSAASSTVNEEKKKSATDVTSKNQDNENSSDSFNNMVSAKKLDVESTEEEKQHLKVLDIKILNKEGNEVEPSAKVSVNITLNNMEYSEDVKGSFAINHIVKNTPAPGIRRIIKAANSQTYKAVDVDPTVKAKGRTVTAEFETDSFSSYAISWTSREGTTNLDGKTVIIAQDPRGRSLSSTPATGVSGGLQGDAFTVGQGPYTENGETKTGTIISSDAALTRWHLTRNDNGYYIQPLDSNGQITNNYLYINNNNNIGVRNTRSTVYVQIGSGNYNGKVRLANSSNGGNAVNLYANSSYFKGFGGGLNRDDNEMLTLYEVKEEEVPPLTPVETLDTSNDITMRMIDYSDNEQEGYNIGGGYNGPVHQGLLNRVLSNGYPETTGGRSLNGLFAGGTNVNHLFLTSTYNETGYYEYSSFKNYAYLGNNRDFTVYNQIGTPSNGTAVWYKRGNFMPYNKIAAGGYSTNTNDYDENGNALSDDDPRKGEVLYKTQGENDYHFGMYLNTNFAQLKDGKVTHNGTTSDMVYEFNGDDDLWVYIDNVLVLDIGGIHDAHSGSINFATGDVEVNCGGNTGTVKTTIKQQFREAGVFPDGTAWDETKVDQYFSGNTFKDYTGHNMKMFYMERGGGASNLHMRFNLPVIPEGNFDVTKELSNTDKEQYANVQFAFQAFKKGTNGVADTPLTNAVYQGTGKKVDFSDNVTFAEGGETYNNVFYLKPGETARFSGLNINDEYYVKEIGVVSDEFDQVKVNGTEVTDQTDTGTVTYHAYTTTSDTPQNRPVVTFTNNVSGANKRELHIKKVLDGGFPTETPTFTFNIQLEGTDGQLTNYNGSYYLKDGDGNYYTNNGGTLTSNGKNAAVAGQIANGTVSGIPAGYEVIITEILSGTDFYVSEPENSIPSNYEYVSTAVTSDSSYQSDAKTTNNTNALGSIKLNYDSQVVITNKGKGQKVKFVKVDSTDTSKGLSGAEFALVKDNENISGSYLKTSGDDGVFSSNKTANPDDGIITLPFGTYTLKETKTPDHYVVLGNTNITVDTSNVEASNTSVADVSKDENGVYIIKIKNTLGTALPETGGNGTLPYTLGGLAIIAMAALMYGFVLRRNNRERRFK